MDQVKVLFEKNGYVLVPNVFSECEIELMSKEFDSLIEVGCEGVVMEDDERTVRSINAPHHSSTFMAALAQNHKLLGPSIEFLGGDVYVHQYKINVKRAFKGERWEWHSDFWFWNQEDGMPTSNALTAVIFLDDVNDFNGPMLLIPQTHRDVLTSDYHHMPYGELTGGDNWRLTTASTLKYQLKQEYLAERIEKKGIVSATGKKGSVLFFHSNLLHASTANTSPWDRRGIFISYNLVSNKLRNIPSPRPEFLASRNFAPLRMLEIV